MYNGYANVDIPKFRSYLLEPQKKATFEQSQKQQLLSYDLLMQVHVMVTCTLWSRARYE